MDCTDLSVVIFLIFAFISFAILGMIITQNFWRGILIGLSALIITFGTVFICYFFNEILPKWLCALHICKCAMGG